MSDFPRALVITVHEEGGWSNNPKDPGGATMKGVTQRVFDAYCTKHGLPLHSVGDISDGQLQDIYQTGYWHPAGCDQLPWPLNAAVFDFAVNSGVHQAVLELQRTLSIPADGVFGPMTHATAEHVMSSDGARLIVDYLMARRGFYRTLVAQKPNLHEFLNGWLSRVDRIEPKLKA